MFKPDTFLQEIKVKTEIYDITVLEESLISDLD